MHCYNPFSALSNSGPAVYSDATCIDVNGNVKIIMKLGHCQNMVRSNLLALVVRFLVYKYEFMYQ